MSAAGAPIAADGDQQGRRPPPERLMGKLPGNGVTHGALLPAVSTPPVLVGDAAGQHCTIRFHALPGHLKPEFIEPAKSGQVSTGQARITGSVGHVEVFLMGSVRTPILGRPRPLARQRHADRLYTLICEEPEMVSGCSPSPNSRSIALGLSM